MAGSTLALTLCYDFSALAADASATLYSERCAPCHGDTGRGDGPAGKYLQPPPAAIANAIKGRTDDWIAKVIKGGGGAVGESPTMPASPDLSDDQVKGLIDYLRHLGS